MDLQAMRAIVAKKSNPEFPGRGNRITFRRFRPHLTFGYQQELYWLTKRLASAEMAEAEVVLKGAIAAAQESETNLRSMGFLSNDLTPTLQYLAALHVLRDLIIQGWAIKHDDEGVLLGSPDQILVRTPDPEQIKKTLRRSFSFAREAQLRDSSISNFIRSMERRGIGSLFANGAELKVRLTRMQGNAIVPQLEPIEPESKDPATGILLQDIWRYARHYWSIPYQSTPGRNIYYLVRDAAVPSRPLIGIAALGSPLLGLSPRDDFYGWSAQGLRKQLEKLTPQQQRDFSGHLFEVVENGFAEIYSADLLPNVQSTDWRRAIRFLKGIERDSALERLKQLEEAGEERSSDYLLIRDAHKDVDKGYVEAIDWERVARTSLYKRKRAGTLADLFWAFGTLVELGFSRMGGLIEKALSNEQGIRAVEIGLRRIKQQVIASSVMELITCGAVPPYRDVLGGKLVAMLMLSRTVVNDFQAKYANRVSLIASAIAGKPIYRPSRLALITTSSLYPVGSSQYNRIKVPIGGGVLRYCRIGITDSFGTVHFAPDTVECLSRVARLSEFNRRNVNNLFGEGSSPKLRLLRSGLDALGLASDAFLRHHSPRLLYGAALCSNINELLLGLSDTPEYILPEGAHGTQLLVEHWRSRWLSNRISRPEILERLRDQRFETFRLGLETDVLPEVAKACRASQVNGEISPRYSTNSDQKSHRTFIERLYRSTKSYADRLNQEELEAIHVDLGVDDYLLDQAKGGHQIVVTGNPGDGKTHLIERLRPQLEDLGAYVITDANACSDHEILESWRSCQKEGRPFVLAINEWPLYMLQRLARNYNFTAVHEALRQVTSGRFFVDAQRPEDPKDNVIVIDLSLRNLLAPPVVERVIERLTQDRFYIGLNPADPAVANREALRHPQVRERLTELLYLVGMLAGHVSMRQLIGFVAFLITGGQPEADRLRAGQDTIGFAYSTLAFEGGIGPLFNAVRAVFDPVTVTHPEWDERLWLGETEPQAWLRKMPPSPLVFPESERESAYRVIKRKFFFEHAKGADLLWLVPNDEREFQKLLRSEEEARAGLVRELVLALNRFYEPDCLDEERDRLQLWQSHRYDVRAPSTFVALHSLPYQQLRVERLKFASWVEAWLSEEQRARHSFALVAKAHESDVALLEIDRDLYLTLFEAQRGLGRSSWARTATRRITRFIDNIHRAVETSSSIEDIRIRNVECGLDERFAIQRTPPRYQL